MTTEGQRQKQEGISRAILGSDVIYRIRFNNRLADLADAHQPFTSEDVTSVVGIPNDKVVGALMNAASTGGYIRRAEMVPAQRENQHAALIGKWIGTGKPMVRVPLIEDDAPRTGWYCTTCGQPAAVEPMPGIDPRFGIGKCYVCKKAATFRR